MNVCHLNTQFGTETLTGANALDWLDSRAGVAVEFPDFDLDIELRGTAKSLDSSAEFYQYGEHELGTACLGAEGDWLTESIVLPSGGSEQNSGYSTCHFNPEFTVTAGHTADFLASPPDSVSSCRTDGLAFNDDVITSILGDPETRYPSTSLISWCLSADDIPSSTSEISGPDNPGEESVTQTRKRDLANLEKEEDAMCGAPVAKNRKKEQNKSAALKYRQKKKEEQFKLEDRRDRLEKQNQKLQDEVLSLEKEIIYLKQLWQELHRK